MHIILFFIVLHIKNKIVNFYEIIILFYSIEILYEKHIYFGIYINIPDLYKIYYLLSNQKNTFKP